jgi:hypothetical protein
MRSKWFLLLWILFISSIVYGQKGFTVYYAKALHNKGSNDLIAVGGDFQNYRLITQHFIDPKNVGIVDLDLLEKNIIRIFPNKSANELICLDLENSLFYDLSKYKKTDSRYKNAEQKFISMIRLVRKLRPNLKIGIYALPQRYYYDQSKETDLTKYDSILQNCDVIMPSLYLFYPDKQVGKNANISYLEKNLRQALSYGSRLNKPVVPFVWSMIHPSNKRYAYQLVSKGEMKNYIQTIRNFTYKNSSVSGIVWWEAEDSIFANWYKGAYKSQPGKGMQDNIILDYFDLKK